LADPGLDPALAQQLFEHPRGVAAVGPQLAWPDALAAERVDDRDQVTTLVLVTGG
jgi:hypothetical protein